MTSDYVVKYLRLESEILNSKNWAKQTSAQNSGSWIAEIFIKLQVSVVKDTQIKSDMRNLGEHGEKMQGSLA